EIAALEAIAARVRPGRGRVVGVVGAAGVGKSRLCAELGERCRARGWVVHEAHGVAHRRDAPGLALAELAHRLGGTAELAPGTPPPLPASPATGPTDARDGHSSGERASESALRSPNPDPASDEGLN